MDMSTTDPAKGILLDSFGRIRELVASLT